MSPLRQKSVILDYFFLIFGMILYYLTTTEN